MFKDYKTNENAGGGNNKNFFGVAETHVLAINPTVDQLTAIIGDNATKFKDAVNNYPAAVTPYSDDKEVRPVNFWLTDIEKQVSPVLKSFGLVNEQRTSKEGKLCWLGIKKGTYSGGDYTIFGTGWYEEGEAEVGKVIDHVSRNGNPYTFEVLSPCRVGEDKLYDFYRALVGWREDDKFLPAMKDHKLDFDTVYSGDFSGLHELVEHADESDLNFVGIFSVRLTDKGPRQSFVMNSNTWLSTLGGITDYHLDKLASEQKSTRDRGYDLSNDEYIVSSIKEYDPNLVDADVPVESQDVSDWVGDDI